MFVDTEVKQQRAKSYGDIDNDDDVQIVKMMLNQGQLSPVNGERLNLNLYAKVAKDHDDEESSYVKTSYQEGGPFPHNASLSCVSEITKGEKPRNIVS